MTIADYDPASDAPYSDDDIPDTEADQLDEQTRFFSRVSSKTFDLRVLDEARKRLARENLEALKRPDPIRLDELLARQYDDTAFAIARLLPDGGRFLLTGRKKLGKSTLLGNLLRAVADGKYFLGQFEVIRPARVALIDLELDERMLRRWLADQDIKNTAKVTIVSLRGFAQTFNILDDQTRAAWAKSLAGHDMIILDCLRPALDALGLDESHDAGRFLVAFDALLAEAGASLGGVVHHAGHSNERGRGDSRIEDWPDAIWRLVGDKGKDDGTDDYDGPRYFSAFGRDVQVHEAELTYIHETRRLTIENDAPSRSQGTRDRKRTEADEAVLQSVTAQPGLNSRELRDACQALGITHNPDTDAAAIRLEARGAITRRRDGRAVRHYPGGQTP